MRLRVTMIGMALWAKWLAGLNRLEPYAILAWTLLGAGTAVVYVARALGTIGMLAALAFTLLILARVLFRAVDKL